MFKFVFDDKKNKYNKIKNKSFSLSSLGTKTLAVVSLYHVSFPLLLSLRESEKKKVQ